MKKDLKAVKIESVKEILHDLLDAEYLAIYSPQMTILILDKDKKHTGSIVLK